MMASNMTRSFVTLSLILLFSVTNGQEVTVKTDKATYKIDERIYLEYEVRIKVDSTSKLSTTDFMMASGPNTNSFFSNASGQTIYTYKLSYVIKARHAGNLEIPSPVFYIKNEKLKAETIHIKVTDENLTEKEIDKIKFDEFKEEIRKPDGTLRLVLSEEYGYVEEFKNDTWILKRRMTKREIAKARKK
jgi:hypothetical protein